MDSNLVAQQLHDRATRGAALAPEEQACLNQWYARQDQEEGKMLAGSSWPQSQATLQVQVDAALARLQTVAQRIQVLAAENDSVRREIGVLHRQLVEKANPQPT